MPGGRGVEPVRDVWSLGAIPGAGPGREGPTRSGSMSLHPGSYECYGVAPETMGEIVLRPVRIVDKVEAPPDTLSITGMNGQEYLK